MPVSVFSDYAEFRALNPAVRAPTLLLDDGTLLTDSHVIIEHFDRLAGESSLWPRDQSVRSRSARSEEHTSELQSLMRISYAVFCLKKKKQYYVHNYRFLRYTYHQND